MSRLSTPTRAGRVLLSAALAIGMTAGAAVIAGAPASAASNGFIAVPNGMVGVSETITINAPKAKGQIVTIGLQLGAAVRASRLELAVHHAVRPEADRRELAWQVGRAIRRHGVQYSDLACESIPRASCGK